MNTWEQQWHNLRGIEFRYYYSSTPSGFSLADYLNTCVPPLHPQPFAFLLSHSLKFKSSSIISGWWLSMEPEDTFFKRLQPLDDFARLYEKSERFGTWNPRTLGIILVRIHR